MTVANTTTANRILQVAGVNFWNVESAALGDGALSAILRSNPDLVLLDARQPNQSFAEFCRAVRSEITNVELVTLVSAENPRSISLIEAGADECWTDPVDSREFQVRLAAVHRRICRLTRSRTIRCGSVELDLDAYTIRCGVLRVHLTVTQLKVMACLMESAGVVISHQDLLERAWNNPNLDKAAVRTCVKRLRQLLAATGARDAIRSVRGGYTFDTEAAPSKVPWKVKSHPATTLS